MNDSHKKKIRKMYRIGFSVKKLSELFNITENEVLIICKNVKRI